MPWPWKSYGLVRGLYAPARVVWMPAALQRAEHRLDVLARVDGAQAGEDVERVLAEAHAVVLEAERLGLAVVAADRRGSARGCGSTFSTAGNSSNGSCGICAVEPSR